MKNFNKIVSDSVPNYHSRNELSIMRCMKITGIAVGRASIMPYTVYSMYCEREVTESLPQIMITAWMSLKKPQGNKLITPTTNIFKQLYGYVRLNLRWLISRLPGLGYLYNISYLSQEIEKHIFRNEDLRVHFEHKLLVLHLCKQSNNHTHPKSASERTGANIDLVNLATNAGYRPYIVSQSNSDCKMGLAGSRDYHWAKDLSIPHKNDIVEDKDCLIFIDVDFHCDMNKYLNMFKPMLIYTFAPSTVEGGDVEHSYRIKDNNVIYQVKGGATYKHPIWDYAGDCITKIDDDGALLTFDITQKNVKDSPGRKIVFIMPRTHVPWPYHLHLNVDNGLKRKEYTTGQVNLILMTLNDIASIGLNGSYGIELPGRVLVSLVHRLKSKKSMSPEIGDIETFLLNERAVMERRKLEIPESLLNPKITASLLHQIILQIPELRFNNVSTSEIPTTYTALGPLVTVDAKITCQVISTPLATKPALIPAKHANNEIAAVGGRITKMYNDIEPTREYKLYADEFAKIIVPLCGIGNPWTYQQVIDIQDKAAQRARAAMVYDTLAPYPLNALDTFNKIEAYNGTSDPRIITTMKPSLTIDMSRFTMPFKEEVLKKINWYAPGNNPDKLLERIALFGQEGLIDTDYTRFDGTISKWLQRNIVLRTYMRWSDPNMSSQFEANFEKVFLPTAKTASGLMYEAGWGTRSGSPLTTDGNTMINAFIVYASLRTLHRTPEQSWEKLGLYAGDDGLSPNVAGLNTALIQTSTAFGLKLKISEHDADQPVPFLGRIIPRPLTSKDTFQDPKRTIPKLHITTNKTTELKQAAFNRAMGYDTTDKHTPVIGTWASKIMELSGLNTAKNRTNEELWKHNESNAWPQTDPEFIRTMYAEHMGLTVAEVSEQVSLIQAVTGDLPANMPIIFDNTSEHPDKLDALTTDGVIETPGSRVIEIDLICKTNPKQTKTKSKKPMINMLKKDENISNVPSKNMRLQGKNGSTKESKSPPTTTKKPQRHSTLSSTPCSQTGFKQIPSMSKDSSPSSKTSSNKSKTKRKPKPREAVNQVSKTGSEILTVPIVTPAP